MTTDPVVMDVSQDWAIACDVQQRFMQHPDAPIEALSYSGRCRQVRALGGDFYGVLPLSQNLLALAVGDASGKSLAAALMISSVQSSLRTAASFAGSDAVAVVRAVNSQVYASFLADRFATLFYGVFDGTTRLLRYVNAGHNPPVVLHRDGSVDWLEPSGAPVGLFADANWEERVVPLQPGDQVLAYTDGVTEAPGPTGEEWGNAGLLQAASHRETESADELVRSILNSMDDYSRGVQTDDATVAVLRVL